MEAQKALGGSDVRTAFEYVAKRYGRAVGRNENHAVCSTGGDR